MRPRLHDYELLARLGGSDWANVFLARDRSTRPFRLLALKILLPRVATDASTLDVFFTEARIASQIQHPNVVNTMGFGQIEGVHCLSMEYVFGASLAELVECLASQGLTAPTGWALNIAIAVAEGLHAAHEHKGEDGALSGVVHRTVNPRNIMVAFDGRVKVMDFGSVKARARGFETRYGQVKGSAGYMSPEQARGESLDRRSDVFSLGVVLWELLTNQRLFPEDSPLALLEDLQTKPIPAPSTIDRKLPPSLDFIVGKALARDRDKRFASAQLFAETLRSLMRRAGLTPDQSLVGLQTRAVYPAVAERGQALHAAVHGDDVPQLSQSLQVVPTTSTDIPVIPGGMTADDPLRLFEHRGLGSSVQRYLDLTQGDADADPFEVVRAERQALVEVDAIDEVEEVTVKWRPPPEDALPPEEPAPKRRRPSSGKVMLIAVACWLVVMGIIAAMVLTR